MPRITKDLPVYYSPRPAVLYTQHWLQLYDSPVERPRLHPKRSSPSRRLEDGAVLGT